jgi:hypothetical protein
MTTWLDLNCRHALRDWNETKKAAGLAADNWDPRRAFAYATANAIALARADDEPMENSFFSMMMPFGLPYLPEQVDPSLPDGIPRVVPAGIPRDSRPLGIILRKDTANLLSATTAANIPDELWRQRLGKNWTVCVDIPHSALTFDTGRRAGVVQLRAILAASWLPGVPDGYTQFVVQLTERGTETPYGRIGGVLCPDGSVRSSVDKSGAWVDRSLQPPFVDANVQELVLERTGAFLRLVMCYYFFGPDDVRETIPATPVERLKKGKPGKGNSLFAMTRLQASDKLGRPASSNASGWSLSERQEISGHFKLQAYGQQWSLRRMIWVSSYERGVLDGPLRAKGIQV